jgi:hypothetical protein
MTKKLAHIKENFIIDIEDRTQEEILKTITDAGYAIGNNSLTMLLNGSCLQAGVFEVIDMVDPLTKKEPVAAKEKVIKPKAKAKSRVVTDATAPTSPISVLEGSKNAQMLALMARPEGVTWDELMKEMGWTSSCLASIIYTVPKSKGYAVASIPDEDDVLHYHLNFIGGAGKVLPEQVLYRERKGVSKKAVEPEPTTKVRISRSVLKTVPVGAAAQKAAARHAV